MQKQYGIKPGNKAKVTLYFNNIDLFHPWEPCDTSNAQGTEFINWISTISPCYVGDIGPDDKGVLERFLWQKLKSNPKQLENFPNLNAELDGIAKEDEAIEVKKFKLL